MLGVATKVAGVAGSRMSSAMGKAAGHIKKVATPRSTANVLDPAVVRDSVTAMASGKTADLDPAFKKAVNRWVYSSDPAHLGDDLDIIRQATRQSHIKSDRPLYRGVRHTSNVREESILAGGSDIVDWDKLEVGSEFKLGATSWTPSETIGAGYAQPMGTVLEMPAGSSGLKIGSEFVTEGSFRVKSIDPGDLKRPRKVALEKVDDKISASIAREGTDSDIWNEISSIDMSPPRASRRNMPTPDKGMLMQPRHSTARYGVPKRSKG